MTGKGVVRSLSLSLSLLMLALLTMVSAGPLRALTQAQEPPSQQAQAEQKDSSVGGELAKETREAAGDEQEENANLKHSPMVQRLAKLTGLSVHQAYLLAIVINFALIAFLVYWFARKSVPAAFRNRTQSIQQALEEARAASQDANRRLAEIEARLRKLDVEIGTMQAAAEKEAEAEEARIQKAAEEEMDKVVAASKAEIAAAAKQARRELTAHTADLAIALARKQINVDAGTDQELVRNFAGRLSGNSGKDGQ
jgi:F-type H+-transporting ATPase subunit b